MQVCKLQVSQAHIKNYEFLFIITLVPYLTICPPLSLPFYFAPCLPLEVTSMFNMYLKYQQTKNYYDGWADCSCTSYSLFRGHQVHKKKPTQDKLLTTKPNEERWENEKSASYLPNSTSKTTTTTTSMDRLKETMWFDLVFVLTFIFLNVSDL